MPTFVVETYLSALDEDEPERTIARASAAIGEISAAGQAIRYVRSIFIPVDETCLLVVEAGSAELVAVAIERAGLDPDRIARAETREPEPLGPDEHHDFRQARSSGSISRRGPQD